MTVYTSVMKGCSVPGFVACPVKKWIFVAKRNPPFPAPRAASELMETHKKGVLEL